MNVLTRIGLGIYQTLVADCGDCDNALIGCRIRRLVGATPVAAGGDHDKILL